MEGTILSPQEEWDICVNNFYTVASFQGRFAYFIMSFHIVNPSMLNYFFPIDLFPYLWVNMVYGMTLLIFSRPSLKTIAPVNRMAFGILGSLMFNHSSLVCWRWLETILVGRPYLLTFMGFLAGRIMMVHLLAFLYHMDSRTHIPGVVVPRDPTFEGMYSRV